MCSPCRQKFIKTEVVKTAIIKMRLQIEKSAETAARDHADMGFDCCDGSDRSLYEAIWQGLQELGFIPESETFPYESHYNEAYRAERVRLGYQKSGSMKGAE